VGAFIKAGVLRSCRQAMTTGSPSTLNQIP